MVVIFKHLLTPKRCLLAALVFYVLMVGLGSIPGNRQELGNLASARLLHFGAYSFLSILLYYSVTYRPLHRALYTLLAIALLAAVDEAIQGLLPYRTGAITDWAFDMLVAALCVSLLTLFTKHLNPLC